MSQWLFAITPLTPLHIGSGETLDPYEYVILDSKLYQFSPEQLLMELSQEEQETFVELVGSNPGKLQLFLQQRKELVIKLATNPIPVASTAYQLYESQLHNPRADLSLYPFIKTTHKPFIPGSSLKGAIRTAMLYAKAHKHIREFDSRKLEQQTFRYAQVVDDPFKAFKISDSQSFPGTTYLVVVKVQTKDRDGRWHEGIPMLHEVTCSTFSSNFQQSFIHPVQLREEFNCYDPRLMKFEMDGIIAACRLFYERHLEEEAKCLAALPQAATYYNKLMQWEKGLPRNSFLVRFGWGSGFDAVTVNYAQERPERKSSRRLADGEIPLGWAQIKVERC